MKRSRLVVAWVCLFTFVFSLTLMAADGPKAADKPAKKAKADPKAQGGTEMPSDLPGPVLTLGAQGGDGMFEGFGDILAPVYVARSGLWFINPRFSMTDDEEEELNIGLGYRHLFPDAKVILGGNVYYDSRWTRNDNRFDQVGFGVEALTEWVDARANYYLPEDDEVMADSRTETDVQASSRTSTRWYDPYAEENEIKQEGLRITRTTTTTTTFLFEQFEQAREGWDAEIGFKLPGVDQWADVKVFGGYYSWDNEYAGREEIEGFKGRLEIKLLPALYLDAAVFEDEELNGSDWTAGGRLSLPFDTAEISKGKNPFGGAFKKSDAAFANRLVDMVMRDLHVRTEVSDWQENVAERQVQTATRTRKRHLRLTLMDDVTFVDDDNVGDPGEDGTAEHPYDAIQEGVDNAFGERNVYVYAAQNSYNENVLVPGDTTVWGQGCPVRGNGGKNFGGDRYPVVDGVVGGFNGAVFRTFNNAFVTIRGFEITHSPGGINVGDTDNLWGTYPVDRVGIWAENSDFLTIDCNYVHDNSAGALILMDDLPNYAVRLRNNWFDMNSGDNVQIDARGSGGGLFQMEARGNTYSWADNEGIEVDAINFGLAVASFSHERAINNDGNGFLLDGMTGNDALILAMHNVRADYNGEDGIDIADVDMAVGTGPFLAFLDGIRCRGNDDDGLDMNVDVDGLALMILADGKFMDNGDDGVRIHIDGLTGDEDIFTIIGPDGALLDLLGGGIAMPFFGPGDELFRGLGLVQASGNDGDGIHLTSQGAENALAVFMDVQAEWNDENGILGDIDAANWAGAVFIPSQNVLEYGEDIYNAIAGLLGLPPAEFPDATYRGPILAEHNGLYGINFAVQGAAGGAGIGMMNVHAKYNGMDGIIADVQSDEIALAGFMNVEANWNTIRGINLSMRGDNQVALGAILNSEANNNQGGSGIFVNQASLSGTTVMIIDPTEASGNAGDGIFLFQNAVDGGAMAILMDITANNNAFNGIYVDQNAAGAGNDAMVMLAGCQMAGNGLNGALLDTYSDQGTAGAILVANRAERNALNGLNLIANAPNGVAGTEMMGNIANRNDQYGILVDLDAGGVGDNAVAVLFDCTANNNEFAGISVDANSANGGVVGVFEGLRAGNNGWMGIDAHLQGDGGDAMGMFEDIRVNGNGWMGLDADIYGNGGSANGYFYGIQANGNAWMGIDAYVEGNVDARAEFDSVEANGNTWMGLDVVILGVNGAGAGIFYNVRANNSGWMGIDATIEGDLAGYGEFDRVRANNNAWMGLDVEIEGANGDADGFFRDIRANGNEQTGIDAEIVGGNGYAYGEFDGVEVNNNGEQGLDTRIEGNNNWAEGRFWDITANNNGRAIPASGLNAVILGINGTASGDFDGVDANDNSLDGIQVNINGGVGQTTAFFNDIEVRRNNQFGIEAILTAATGPLQAEFTHVNAHRNGADGIWLDANAVGAGQNALIGFGDVELMHNGVNGLTAQIDAGGQVTLAGDHMTVYANGLDGILVNANAPATILDFGGGGAGSPGQNVFYKNGVYGVDNIGAGLVTVENNYWGGDAPAPGAPPSDYSVGVVAPATWLNDWP